MEKKRYVSKVKAILNDLHKEEKRRGAHVYIPFHLKMLLEELKTSNAESLVEVIARLVAEHHRKTEAKDINLYPQKTY